MNQENASVKTRITISLCKDSRDELDRLSKITDRSYSATIRHILLKEMQKHNSKPKILEGLDDETLEDVALGLTILQALAAQFDEQIMREVSNDSGKMVQRWNNNA